MQRRLRPPTIHFLLSDASPWSFQGAALILTFSLQSWLQTGLSSELRQDWASSRPIGEAIVGPLRRLRSGPRFDGSDEAGP